MDKPDLSADISPDLLQEVVSCALETPEAQILDWSHHSLGWIAVNSITGGLYRLHGNARVGQETLPWSVILKTLRAPNPMAEPLPPSHPFYWKREALVYPSALVRELPEGLAAPNCYAVTERDDGCWLWLEEIIEDQLDWDWPRYELAAYHLGLFNGAYLAGRPLPAEEWLAREDFSRDWARNRVAQLDWEQLSNPVYWEIPEAEGVYDRTACARMVQWRDDQERFYAALESMPPTLCHHDAGRLNFLSRQDGAGQPETVALDWSFTGYGSLGDDIGAFVGCALLWQKVHPGEAETLERAALGGYLSGLRDAGWDGEEATLRIGYLAALVANYGVFVSDLPKRIRTREGAAFLEKRYGKPFDELLPLVGRFMAFLFDRADELRSRI